MKTEEAHHPYPYSAGPETKLTLPLVTLIALLGAVAVAYATFSGTRDQVTRNTIDISEMKKAQAQQNDILIRIDENVKQIKAYK